MPVCIRCQENVGLLGVMGFDKQSGRCGKCQKEVGQALVRFRNAFLNASYMRLITEGDWAALERGAQYDRLDMREALAYVLADSLHFLERTLTFFFADNHLSEDEETYFRTFLQLLAIPYDHARPLLDRLGYLKYLTAIRGGVLPTVQVNHHLESDEICHLAMGANFYKINAKSVKQVPGRFLATNKRLHFLSTAGGTEIPWKRVMRIEREGNGLYLELSTKKGNGRYDVADPLLAEAVFETLVKISKREIIGTMDAASRHIPQDVKIAVWQRDQGRCVQCGSNTYLEFDHIIPFSKGGASTVNNVQLLCRRCNLAKGGQL